MKVLLESVPGGAVLISPDRIIIYWNQWAEKITGYRAQDALGKRCFEFLKNPACEACRLFDRPSPPPIWGQECILKGSSGQKIYVLKNASVLKSPEGHPVGALEIFIDITAKKMAEERLVQLERLKALGELAAGVAHDLNNVLTVIEGNLSLAKKECSPKAQRRLEVIEKAARDGAEIVQRIKQFARLGQAGEIYPVAINEVVLDAIKMTRPRWKTAAQSEGIHYEVRTDLRSRSFVLGNASQIREILTNLIINALDAMPQGGIIDIRTEDLDSQVRLIVKDTGCGIPPEIRPYIFDPFFSTKGEKSSGLGLSICYSLVRHFRGEIEVESNPGKGTKFIITLPKAKDPSLEAEEEPESKEVAMTAKILVVEDDPFVRDLLAEILETAGHQVELATDGQSALEQFSPGLYDIVITDQSMPGISGRRLATSLKNIDPEVIIILVTGWQTSSEELRESGVDYFLAKPFKIERVLSLIQQILEKTHPDDQVQAPPDSSVGQRDYQA
ncbi:ATP-binding protein [Thermosulfuriphilus sp.]